LIRTLTYKIDINRIGQTREVHIFRLVTQHTIEENILKKAKQKRNLDVLVMDQGNFNTSMLNRKRIQNVETAIESNNTTDLYTKGGLREILGIGNDTDKEARLDEGDIVSSEQLETTMTSLEDIDDANALKGSRKEAEDELKEFDESIEYKKESDADDDDEVKVDDATENAKSDVQSEEKELEKEIAAWQDKSGVDPSLIEASLSPVERYGLRFCEVVDPYYSIFAVLEYNQQFESQAGNDDIDINQIDKEKGEEENRAFEEGDLLATHPRPDDLLRQINLYRREKARLSGNKKRRRLTGEDWEQRFDSTQTPFWQNVDTGEAVWEKPKVLVELDSFIRAHQDKWSALPMEPLIHIMSFLHPFPDRMHSSEVCIHWYKAAKDSSFVRHVYPVEMGAYTRDDDKIEYNHYRTVEAAVKSALPGDTIGTAFSFFFFIALIGEYALTFLFLQNLEMVITGRIPISSWTYL
jgi:F-box-like